MLTFNIKDDESRNTDIFIQTDRQTDRQSERETEKWKKKWTEIKKINKSIQFDAITWELLKN